MSRVVVIGAGVGGLAAAARLAALGHEVALHERADTHGGKLGVAEVGGFTFDTGPSLLTLPAVLEDVFAATGGPSGLVVEPVDPVCAYTFADGTRLDMPHDPAAVPAALDAALGPGTDAAWQALHARSGRLWELVGEAVLRRPLDLRTLLRMSARLEDLRAVAPWRTLAGLGRELLPDPRLRTWFARYATYSGSDFRRTPAVLSVTPYVEQRFGGWYVRGGLRRIADALLDRCRELGVAVHLGSEVDAVILAGGAVRGVRVCGREVPADIVVCNADASLLYERLLPADTARQARRELRRAPRSLAGFVLLLGLDGRDHGPAHRVWFPENYAAEFDAIFGRQPRPVPDPTIYVHSPADPALRPDDASEGWFVLVNAPVHDPGRGVDWDAPGLRERYADHVLATLAGRGTDVRDRIRVREIRTPADLERDAGAPGGAIYGTASHGPRAALRRPANRSPVPGLYLVGGSAHPGGGLPLVLLSAEITAGLIGPAGTPAGSPAGSPPPAGAAPPRPRPSTRPRAPWPSSSR
ncbi:phytoene desaturase family protein [Pseudonocardia sp. RS11V-5]|uniref:phytoene desaturase family protein n=1 Tax=Pseudonocardia terrae TaxID=2905831 RepID=UPI001E3CDE2F|nr:phytoene desaturase family protein [Pseudonocardia terrae]MCE3553640.1 phytoene desaturase family protein [Pseudonocardia terrae]